MRRDAKTCSKRCRQASWRFKVERCELAAYDEPMRFAYADPPYPGKAGYYVGHPDYAGEVDHQALVRRLVANYPDGWALSTSSDALREVWTLCPSTTRLYVWVKGARRVRSRRASGAYEALLVNGGRPQSTEGLPEVDDVLIYGGRHLAFPGRVVGMKPPAFAEWMFRLLGARRGDELDDLFPGSGAVSEAWARYVDDPSRRAPARDASFEVLRDASRGDRADASRPAGGRQLDLVKLLAGDEDAA